MPYPNCANFSIYAVHALRVQKVVTRLVHQVIVHNRHNRPGRLNGGSVWVSETPDYTTGAECAPGLTSSGVQPVACNAVGGYVTVVLATDYLHICEVEVFLPPYASLPADGACGAGYAEIATSHECTAAQAHLGLAVTEVLPCTVCALPRADQCSRGVSASLAEEICAADGGRLCTEAEIEAECVSNGGCGTANLAWTSTPCELGAEDKMSMCHMQSWTPPTDQCPVNNDFGWLDHACTVQVQVDTDGFVNVIHTGDTSTQINIHGNAANMR
jgi:hypothetical protein